VPAWVASLGKKGYETDFGYLTRAHPPIRREAVEPAGVPTRRNPSYAPVGRSSIPLSSRAEGEGSLDRRR
ncbi:MAG TPA: hypothetical protein VGC53_16420, partial [Vicinamibacteria bacterium]